MRRSAARRGRALAVAGLVALLLAGCGEDVSRLVPGPPDVDVDTPALRALKADLGVDDCAPGPGTAAVEGGLPAITLPCLGGGTEVDLSTLRGPMVLNFWASWCGPCREEMPALQEFHELYGDQVAIVGVDFQDVRPPAAFDLLEETGATYPSLADPGGELLTDRVLGATLRRGLPAFAWIDADGEVVGLTSGGGMSADGKVIAVEEVSQVVDLVEENLGIRLAAPGAAGAGR